MGVDILSIWAIVGIIIGLIILVIVAVWAVGYFRSSESLTIKPEGAVTGKTLIVYDPGLSGGTKNAASYMAEDLKAKGYEVKLAGVRSKEASDISGYNILIVGSPTYGAKPTGPITSYLENLKSPGNITAGVYALSGGDTQDAEVIMVQMLQNKSIPVKVSVKYGHSAFGASANRSQYSDFISQLLA
jgi:flavodoxin